MVRKLKALGVAFVAVFAMSAVMASASQAAEFTSTFGASLTGEQAVEHEFTTSFGTVSCEIANFAGAAAGNGTSQTITPEYAECFLNGIFPTHIDFTGCDYLFTAGGSVHLACPTGKHVDIEVTGVGTSCVITVFPNGTGYVGITYSNTTAKQIGIGFNVSSITYEYDGCFQAAGHHTDGTYTGTSILSSSKNLSVDTP